MRSKRSGGAHLTRTGDWEGNLSQSRDRLNNMGLGYNIANEDEANARLAMLSFLDVMLGESSPNTPLEYAKADVVRQAIGDNRNASALARLLGLRRSESAREFTGKKGWAQKLEAMARKNVAVRQR